MSFKTGVYSGFSFLKASFPLTLRCRHFLRYSFITYKLRSSKWRASRKRKSYSSKTVINIICLSSAFKSKNLLLKFVVLPYIVDMIFLFTDYGLEGPYIGQVESVLHQLAPQAKVINLMADAPRNNPKASAYLLASLIHKIPVGSIIFSVVDPGVGSGKDKPTAIKIDGRWFVGPDNGLFDIVAKQAKEILAWHITWKPETLSNSFHGRDLYAPVCAMLENKQQIPGDRVGWTDKQQWPEELYEVIYIDYFGNCMTGIRAANLDKQTILRINNQEISNADTFSDVATGQQFWYQNSNGLVEIAVNQGAAEDTLQLKIGSHILLST